MLRVLSLDAVHLAAQQGSIPMLEILVRHGCSLQSRGPQGVTLYHQAARGGHMHVVRWLFEVQKLPCVTDDYGITASRIASRRGDEELFIYFRDIVEVPSNCA